MCKVRAYLIPIISLLSFIAFVCMTIFDAVINKCLFVLCLQSPVHQAFRRNLRWRNIKLDNSSNSCTLIQSSHSLATSLHIYWITVIITIAGILDSSFSGWRAIIIYIRLFCDLIGKLYSKTEENRRFFPERSI